MFFSKYYSSVLQLFLPFIFSSYEPHRRHCLPFPQRLRLLWFGTLSIQLQGDSNNLQVFFFGYRSSLHFHCCHFSFDTLAPNNTTKAGSTPAAAPYRWTSQSSFTNVSTLYFLTWSTLQLIQKYYFKYSSSHTFSLISNTVLFTSLCAFQQNIFEG